MKNPFKTVHPEAPLAGDTLVAPHGGMASPSLQKLEQVIEQKIIAAHAFGNPLNHVKPFMATALQNFTLIAPVLLVTAVTLSVLAAIQASSFIAAFTRQVKSAEIRTLTPLIDKKPLAAADYQSAADVLAKNNSAVQVSLSRTKTSIVLSIKQPALLPEFIYALVTMQSYRQGVAWNAGQICLNKCEGGAAASAEITGYTQAISFSGLRTKP